MRDIGTVAAAGLDVGGWPRWMRVTGGGQDTAASYLDVGEAAHWRVTWGELLDLCALIGSLSGMRSL
jgi:hypothetical protein